MQLNNARIILTGATGGIGQALARELASRGARLGLVGRRQATLDTLAHALRGEGAQLEAIVADVTHNDGRDRVIRRMQRRFGGVDLLINNAGTMAFTGFVEQDPAVMELMFRTNIIAPMQLTRAVLPGMLAQGHGRIVNVGSIFGSIAFAWFASYSASKFALRGFSEALRRELAGSGVGVSYVAPRAVKTALNSPAVYRMAEKVKMNMDDPATVARRIVRAIERDKKDVYLGFPEAWFVRVNALLPRLVDGALRKQNRVMREFIQEA